MPNYNFNVRLLRESKYHILGELDREIFPLDDRIKFKPGVWWVVEDAGKTPVGFCGLSLLDDFVFFKRAGVSALHRCRGIHRRLIQVRLRWAKQHGYHQAVTYTVLSNPQSGNNLVRAGFRLYRPEWKWAGVEVLYWFKLLH